MSIDTVNDLTPRVQYTASAAQTSFDYPFPIFEDADLVVDVDGVTQALSTDYTVAGEGEDAGGTVSFVTPMVGGEIVTIYRDIAIARDTDFQQNGPFRAASINDELDKTFLIMQELESKIGRSIRFAMTDAVTSTETTLSAEDVANKILMFDSDGKPYGGDAASIATVAAFGTAVADVFTATAGQTVFTLSANPGAVANVDLSIDGATLIPTADYTVTGTTLTLLSGAYLGQKVVARYMQGLPTGISQAAPYYETTSAEIAAGVTPTNYAYPVDDARRYGHVADGTTDHTPILNKLIAISASGGPVLYRFQRGVHYFNSRPDDITGPLIIAGQSMNNTVFVRNYSPATADIGLFNFRATCTSSNVQDATVCSGVASTGGSLISVVQPSSGDGADWSPIAIRVRLTSDTALGGSGDSHAYGLYIDGTARTSPQGQRSTLIEDCVLFGGTSGAAYISGVVNFNWNNTSTYSAGGTSGKVVITGTSGVPSSYVNIRGANIYGFALDRVSYLNVQVAEINGDITNTANTNNVVICATQSTGSRDASWVNSVFIDPSNGVLREKSGGNAFVARHNGSNPRAGVYTAGSSGQTFIGGNLNWSSGNTFNFDITGAAWYIGDPGGNGRLSIGCVTGTAGNDASVTGTSDAIRITTDGNLYPGRASSQGMTNGFFYIPSAAGAPSGTPTAISGYIPMYYDTTNNRFYVYNGAWKSVVLA